MVPLKIAVIGGGSSYTPELIEGFLHAPLQVREIALVDIDARKLAIVGGLAQRMAAAAHAPLTISLTDDRAAALDGADVVITQFRVGGLAARVLDERIPQPYGVIGQETTGPGGFAKALRTIPVILDINREMAHRCPGAWLVNFTNPSGIITEAVRLHGQGNYVGLCNYPLTLKMHIAQAFAVEDYRVELAYFGLNHLSWTRVLIDGFDRTEDLIDRMEADPAHAAISGYAFSSERLRTLGLIPSGYLRYFYDGAKMVEEQRAAPQTRGERVREVEERLLQCYADPACQEKPAELQERGGAWYSTAAVRLISDLWSDTGGLHILNVPNEGAIASLPPGVIVESPALVADGHLVSLPTVRAGASGLLVNDYPIPDEVEWLIARMKAYELHTVEAAVTGDCRIAEEALALHPFFDGRHEIIAPLLHDLLTAHKAYLPQFSTVCRRF